ncbi:MAG: iron ABC transporter permease [Candidatus Latescibacterota bacterium]|nr:iron ABC transporter permease [Candidatus Latescibacterota bacterium]
MAAALVGFFALSLGVGSVSIPLDAVVEILWDDVDQKRSWSHIIHAIRLPRALTAVLAGAALSASGLQMQTLFRNPLADPFILGISAGASLGVALVVLATGVTGAGLLVGLGFLGHVGVVVAAVVGAAVVLGLVLLVGRRVQNNMTLLILGLMFGYLTGAIVSVLLYFSIPEQVQTYVLWTFGSFGAVTWGQLAFLAPVVLAGLGIAVLLVKPLNALLLGETYARSMGLGIRRVRLWIIASAALLAGAVTAYCGPIGFLGVAVPHLCRALFNTSDHRVLLPASVLLGAVLALIADLVARLPGSQATLPLNAVTALIGAPVVTWIILRRRDLRQAFAS